jgi:hypothetical protein
MGIKTFLLSKKVKKTERSGYINYAQTFKAMESDVMRVIREGHAEESVALLVGVQQCMHQLEEIEQKYLRVKEKYQNDTNKLLEITTDWQNFSLFCRNLFMHKIDINKAGYEIQAKEIIKKFDRILQEN